MYILAAERDPAALQALRDAICAVSPGAQVELADNAAQVEELCAAQPDLVLFLGNLDCHPAGLIRRLRQQYPRLNVILVADDDQHALAAMALHASGYLLRPAAADAVRRELADLRYPPDLRGTARLRIQCFGMFEVYTPGGTPLHFARKKSREAFAYLVWRRGETCTVRELAAVLFGDDGYDSRRQQYMQKILTAMMEALRGVGAEGAVYKRYGTLTLDPTRVECDWYNVLRTGAPVPAGGFLLPYAWAARP